MITKPKIEIIDEGINDNEIHRTYVMTQELDDLSLYDRTKGIERFINKETKVLEMLLESDLRRILKEFGVIPYDGSESALNEAFDTLKRKGVFVRIVDRYYEIENENIIGESPNKMTIILENDNFISCAMEIVVEKGERYEND